MFKRWCEWGILFTSSTIQCHRLHFLVKIIVGKYILDHC